MKQSGERKLKYNSEQEHLIIPEYGRNVQRLVREAVMIEDDKEREVAARQIVKLMSQVTHPAKNNYDLEAKLWRHLFIISKFKINVHPEGVEVTDAETEGIQPEPIGYPKNVKRFRHYGAYIQELIEKAIEMEDKEKKHGFYSCIASYMKTAYMTWNRDPNITDNVVVEDLKSMVGDRDSVPDDLNVTTTKISIPKENKKGKPNRKRKKNSRSNRRRRR